MVVGEDVAAIEYRPAACRKSYRLVIVRKNLSVQRGEHVLCDEVRYFFYLRNRRDCDRAEVVALASGRCQQEYVIAQLKYGVNAMRIPVDDLVSNWAYMVMTALAWYLNAWFALLVSARERGLELFKMEFRSFLHALVLLPCQIVRRGRRIVWRILSDTCWLRDFFATFEGLL